MFDPAVNVWLQQFSNPLLDRFFLAFTALGTELFYILLLPALFWLVDRRRTHQVALVFLVSMALNGILKEWLVLPRPGPAEGVVPIATETSPGFPSGHAQGSATLWTSLALAYPSAFLVGAAIALIALISLSRLYLGVHYLGDVLGGLAIGLALVAVFFVGYRRGWGGRWPLGLKVVLALLLVPLALFLEPSSGSVRLLGFLLGFLIGDGVGLAHLPYAPQAAVVRQLVKLLVGYGGFFGLVFLVEGVLPAGIPSLLGYGLVALWVTVGAPLVFLATGLAPRRWGLDGAPDHPALARLGVGVLVVVLLLAGVVWAVGPSKGGERLPVLAGLEPGAVQVIAHRGGALEAPENTLVAFGHARVVGATMVELDVHLTADGRVVVLHDETVDRTTDGSGRVRELTLEQVKGLDAAYRFSPDGSSYPFRGLGVRIPTLDEVLQTFPDLPLIVELKDDDPRLAQAVALLLREHGADGRVLVSSFHQGVLTRFRSAAPGVATGMTLQEALPFVLLERFGLSFLYRRPPAPSLQAPERHGILPVAGKDLIERAAERGLPVYVWTVNDEAAMRRWVGLGAAGVITDAPSTLARVVQELRGQPGG
ncbi:glycerophosphodiester phosphodiesterase family protein [Limnochorda pilosa]|uniref:Glycerophosphoryl diester phosphodiesterase n=1 Tax=Limnochorda pilosa TaxID=1555112 RepID=A0A0K2SG99_LIMPI|nr:glycerophosphodiester phosphodiesterase family protein [Limnochorda pilosa]BAS26067.1 glycerophosphoryl diester phosphodiesterase [Limnochorda pilosa]